MEALIISLIKLILDAVGEQQAHELITEEVRRRAYAEADAVAAARKISETV